jgi:TrmH family RNA methyltransferase
MLRSAAAAGVQAALLPPGNTDAYSPKVVRAGMGAHFRVAVAPITWDEINHLVEYNHLKVWLAEAGGETIYTDADLRAPSAIIIGGEAEGPGDEARRLAQGRLRIPMAGKSESLNAATASGILLFEAARQRGWPSLTSRSDR